MTNLARPPDRRLVAIVEALFSVIVWGGSFVATKVALANAAPMTVVWLRFGIGVLLLGAAVTLRRQWRLPGWADLGYFALLGLIGITFHQWLQSTGLLTARATTTAWIVATIPVFMALLGWLVLHEKLTRRQIVGILLAGVGVLVILSKGDLKQIIFGRFGTIGDFLILISAPNWAIFSTLSRRGLQQYPAALMIFFVMLFGWIFSSFLFLIKPGFSAILAIQPQSWGGILFLGIFASGLAYVTWYDALQVLPVAQAGAFVYVEPFVTVLVATWVLKESFGIVELLGALTILSGIWLVNRN